MFSRVSKKRLPPWAGRKLGRWYPISKCPFSSQSQLVLNIWLEIVLACLEKKPSQSTYLVHTNNVLDFTAHQRTCKISWSPWATIPWTIDSLASTGYRTRFTSHILLSIFRCLCVHVCFATWERRSSKTRGCVTLCGLANYIKKYVKAKEELWKLKYFTKQTYNLQKMPLKILQDIITLQ